ncbi:uncharacterized protein LOC115694052 [Syzygium oleosum]|uniref:uncharacterized protein LOC115694052 n=1 Tax=Syzygium oleosum TaxID=219896 RepID=UPI0024B878EA|nr:uncharacterized protein LOC115694052 [Syzygium oleosum]
MLKTQAEMRNDEPKNPSTSLPHLLREWRALVAALAFHLAFDPPFSPPPPPSSCDHPRDKFMLSLLCSALFTLSLLSFLFVSFSLFKRLHGGGAPRARGAASPGRDGPPTPIDENDEAREREPDPDPTRLTHSLLLEILPSSDAAGLCSDADEPVSGSEQCPGGTAQAGKRKKKRAKKKSKRSDARVAEEEEREDRSGSGRPVSEKPELICLYPFTSSGSATQRRIKQHYDELVKCHESKGLTIAQVSQFANCLVEARNELQHKSEVIQRKFTIAKALLFKADRSSFERLRQQIYKLELEQKRLEEDAFVYNWLQQQLKLSPAYKKMLEVGASMELKAKSGELMEAEDSEVPDISFEELLAQEKKDSFWQKTKKSRSGSN